MRKAAVFLASFFLILFIFTSVGFTATILRGRAERDAFSKLTEVVKKEERSSETGGATALAGTGAAARQDILPQYRELYEENPDLAGWLTVPGTNIDYPVMQTPEEPQYYLHRAFDRSDSFSGTPFIGAYGNADTDCLIIYGHNMKNDTMFGTLDYYKAKSFYLENPMILYDTKYEERTYAVVGAFLTKVPTDGGNFFRFASYSGDLTEKLYKELIENITSRLLYETGVSLEYGDQILMLSTCSYHTGNGRFVVVTKRINDS